MKIIRSPKARRTHKCLVRCLAPVYHYAGEGTLVSGAGYHLNMVEGMVKGEVEVTDEPSFVPVLGTPDTFNVSAMAKSSSGGHVPKVTSQREEAEFKGRFTDPKLCLGPPS